MNLNDYIAVIDNYPKKGISFKEIDSESERGKELLKAYGAQSLPLLIEDDAHKNIPVIGNEVVKHLMQR